MRGEKMRPNDGYESVNLSPAEKAGLKPEDVVKLKPKKSKEAALKSVEEQLNKAESVAVEDDFSEDEVTKEYKKPLVTAEGYLTPEGHKDNSRKRVEKAWAEARVKAEENIAKESSAAEEKSKDEAEQVADIKAMKDSMFPKPSGIDEAEEVADLKKIRKSILNESSDVEKLDAEIKAGFKSADKQSISRPKIKTVKENIGLTKEIKSESEKVKNAKIFAENAIRAYSKLYIEYDPKAINKIYDGKKDASDLVAALDLTAITPPPLRAIFSSKGRQLRDVYGKVQEAIKKYNDEVEAS